MYIHERWERLLEVDLHEYVLGGFLIMGIFHLVPSGMSGFGVE